MQRRLDIPTLWFGAVPGTEAPDGTVVTCSYFIFEDTRTIRCNTLASLTPIFMPEDDPDTVDDDGDPPEDS